MYSIRSTRNLAIAKRLHSASLQTTVLPVECHGRNKCIGDDTKSPLAEDQTALGKQIRYVERKYISMALSKFCEKLLPHAKFHWNRTNGYWVMAKNDLQLGGRPRSWIFEIFIFGRVTAIEFQICRCVPNFIKIGWFFCSDMTFWRFSRWRITASFKRTRMGSLKSPCWTSCWSLIEINVKKTVVYTRVNGEWHIYNCKNYKKVITHQHIA